jgi:hypothetical protein
VSRYIFLNIFPGIPPATQGYCFLFPFFLYNFVLQHNWKNKFRRQKHYAHHNEVLFFFTFGVADLKTIHVWVFLTPKADDNVRLTLEWVSVQLISERPEHQQLTGQGWAPTKQPPLLVDFRLPSLLLILLVYILPAGKNQDKQGSSYPTQWPTLTIGSSAVAGSLW